MTIFYSCIESNESSNYYHTEWKEKSLMRQDNWATGTFVLPVGECVHTNPDMFLPQVTDSLPDSLFGPFISPGVHRDHVFDNVSKFFWGKRFALNPLDQGVWSSRLIRACCSISLQTSVLPAFRSWHSSNLKWSRLISGFFGVLSLIIHC